MDFNMLKKRTFSADWKMAVFERVCRFMFYLVFDNIGFVRVQKNTHTIMSITCTNGEYPTFCGQLENVFHTNYQKA